MKPKRFMELEGLRGFAALMVVIDHLVFAFYPTMRSGNPTVAHTDFGASIYGTPLALLYSGTFAVAVFFVLSGFVLSIGFLKTKNQGILKRLAMSRYLRLMLPALASVLMAFVLIKIGFGVMPNAAGAITHSPILKGQWSFDPGFFAALKEGAANIFVHEGSVFNDVLWTMHTEFFGSFMVFAFLALFGKYKYRWLLYGALVVLTFNTWFLAFIIGMIIADIYVNFSLEKFKKTYVTLPLAIGALFLGGMPHGHIYNTFYEWTPWLPTDKLMDPGAMDYEMFYLTLGAAMMVSAVLLSRRLTAFLARPKIALLGRYTFSLYLTHYVILYSFGAAIFLILMTYTGYNTAALLTCLAVLPLFAIVTVLFEKYVDAPSIQFAKYIGAVVRREQKIRFMANGKKAWRRTIAAAEKYIGLSGDPKISYVQDD